jgi:hypothetical protein
MGCELRSLDRLILRVGAIVLKRAALLLSLVFLVLCLAAMSHLAYRTASAGDCVLAALLAGGLAGAFQLLALLLGRIARADLQTRRGFEVLPASPRPVIVAAKRERV